jgi:undecaprenyl-diphosphatase
MRRLDLTAGEKLVLLACVVVLVLLTADVVAGGVFTSVDEQVHDAVPGRWEDATPLQVLGWLSGLGFSIAVLAATALVVSHSQVRVWPLLLAAANTLAVAVVVLTMKALVGRVGPGLSENPAGYSGYFPSGHVATSTVCIGPACFIVLRATGARPHRQTWDGLAVGVGFGVLMALVAVATDQHWLSDVIGGLAVSVGVMTLGFATLRTYVAVRS